MIVKLKRLIATTIDYIIIFFTCYFIFYNLYKLFDNDFANVLFAFIALVVLFVLILRKDCLFGYESIGKKIMRLKIYQENNKVENKKILINRNLATFKFFSIYPFMILINNKSAGDNKYNTEVK